MKLHFKSSIKGLKDYVKLKLFVQIKIIYSKSLKIKFVYVHIQRRIATLDSTSCQQFDEFEGEVKQNS